MVKKPRKLDDVHAFQGFVLWSMDEMDLSKSPIYRMYSIIRPPIFNISLSLKWRGGFYLNMHLVSTVCPHNCGAKDTTKGHVYINAEVVHASYSVSVYKYMWLRISSRVGKYDRLTILGQFSFISDRTYSVSARRTS